VIMRCERTSAACGGVVWLIVLPFVAPQLLAVCHPGGQGPGPENLGISNDE
jgi:hypothetical protein